MRKLILIAGLAALSLPTLAMAQTSCHEAKQDNRAVGTVVGAGVGALIGDAIGGGRGAVVGAVGGGVVGNVSGGASVHCDNGYYDPNGAWHQASGYYDSRGSWVANPTNGYYDAYGRWVPMAPAAYGADVDYSGRGIDGRESWIDHRIQSNFDDGDLTQGQADQDRDRLNAIRRREARMQSDHGGLTDADRADLNGRLDGLSDDLGD